MKCFVMKIYLARLKTQKDLLEEQLANSLMKVKTPSSKSMAEISEEIDRILKSTADPTVDLNRVTTDSPYLLRICNS